MTISEARALVTRDPWTPSKAPGLIKIKPVESATFGDARRFERRLQCEARRRGSARFDRDSGPTRRTPSVPVAGRRRAPTEAVKGV